ncbi:MAG: multidrug efflux SMR transporter [Pseudomonadota bacterium]
MGSTAWALLIVAIILEVIGTSALKATDGFTKLWPSLLSTLCYAGAIYFLSLAMRSVPVGVAYAIWSGLGILLITTAAAFFYGQRLDGPAILGLILIVAGVVVLNLFSKSV